MSNADIKVIDPFGVSLDPQMPSLAFALDPIEAQQSLAVSNGCLLTEPFD